jgi:uncharacterized protein
MRFRFEWDEAKAQANLAKHGVRFLEARAVFGDPFSMTREDQEHSHSEERLVTIGMSSRFRLLVVVHIERDGLIRIISARKANRREHRQYEGE